MPRGRRQSGFSLLEILVAFSILALSLGVLLNIFSTAMRGVGLGAEYSKAASLLDARLAALGSEIPVETGSLSGSEGDREGQEYRWQITLSPFGEIDEFQALGELELFQVDVEVTWEAGGGERRIAVSTLRLASGEGL